MTICSECLNPYSGDHPEDFATGLRWCKECAEYTDQVTSSI